MVEVDEVRFPNPEGIAKEDVGDPSEEGMESDEFTRFFIVLSLRAIKTMILSFC
jgi:hypothetical protein